VWHIVECKGTQSGLNYREVQLSGSHTHAGAVHQKMAVTFPAGHNGQRLACGVALAAEGDPDRTSLKIVDPEDDEEPFEIREQDLAAAEEAAMRSSVAVSLRLAGFHTASDAIASPIGRRPSSRPSRGAQEEERQGFVRQRREVAIGEIENRGRQTPFDFQGRQFYGRQLSLDLPRPVAVGETFIRGVRIRQGVSAEALAILREAGFPDRRSEDFNSLADLGPVPLDMDEGEDSAELKIGGIFASTIDLIRGG
jgi:hypothetical protein